MTTLTLDLLTFDPGIPAKNALDYADTVIRRVEQSWDSGADVTLLPEFIWQGLAPLLPVGESNTSLQAVAQFFWHVLHPKISRRLSHPGKAVVLGTAPAICADGKMRNRAPIISAGRCLFQDKLNLTPWENDFTAGDTLQIWHIGGFRVAVIICLDIEIPELSARLRDQQIDLILCPSATENLLGVERVNRCASARSVELGCYTGVCHLTGSAKTDLIDFNVGRAAFYRPSQAAFSSSLRTEETPLFDQGCHALRVILDKSLLESMRRLHTETNPATLSKETAGATQQIHVLLESP